jgi:hypothetical protein
MRWVSISSVTDGAVCGGFRRAIFHRARVDLCRCVWVRFQKGALAELSHCLYAALVRPLHCKSASLVARFGLVIRETSGKV